MKFLLNTLISALIIAAVAEVGKRSSFVGALLVALPLTSTLALTFLYTETHDTERVASLSMGIFWLVLPTLAFFLILPALLRLGRSFWLSMPAACAAMVALFFGYGWMLAKAGIKI